MSNSDYEQIPVIFESGPLKIRYLRGTGSSLVVSFSGVGNYRSIEPPVEFPAIASNFKQNHVLFVTDISRSWLNGDGMAGQIVRAIQATAEHIAANRVLALGNSMGGTMALHLSKLVDFEQVIAFSPQYSVIPSEVPEEDRWFYFRNRIKTFHFSRVEDLKTDGTKYFILHGDERRELAHAMRFPQQRGVSHFILPGMGHRLASDLKSRGLLAPLIQDVVDCRPRQFKRRILECGAVRRNDYNNEAETLPGLAIAS